MADTVTVPHGAADVDAAWLSVALGTSVADVRTERVGNGMVADSLRLAVTYGPGGSGPASLVAKVPAAGEESRAAAAATRTYELEAAFYNELAGTVDVRAPHCHLSMFDPATGDYVVLLEDVAPAEAGDQLTGCSLDEASAAIAEMAGLHAPRLGDPELEAYDWLATPNPESVEGMSQFVEMLWPGFVERFGPRVEPDVLALAERLMPDMARHLSWAPRPWTLQHCDFRVDNLLFGGPRVVVVDWQTIKVGPGVADLAYFLGASLVPELRRSAEADLVAEYRQRMAAAGAELDADELWRGYRRSGLGGLLMGILASMLVSPTERGDLMVLAMVNRHGLQLLDHEAETLLSAD